MQQRIIDVDDVSNRDYGFRHGQTMDMGAALSSIPPFPPAVTAT